MSYDSDICREIFERLGVYVNWWYQLDETKTALETRLEEAVADFNIRNVGGSSDTPSDADMEAYEALSAEVHRQQQVVDSLRDSIVGMVSDFISLNVRALIGTPYSESADILDDLIELMGTNNPPDTVAAGGRFYTFVEENFQKELPTTSGTPTISDTLAGA